MRIFILYIGLCLCFTTAHLCAQAPLARFGKIKLVGNQLSSECGTAIQLRGISSFGPQFNPNCYNNNSLDAIANDWHADVFRIAMYVNEGGYLSDSSYWKSWIDNQVDECVKRGIYCIIDWHILGVDGDPNLVLPYAKSFWNYMSKKHAGKKNVLYEICNEPNERFRYGNAANEKDVNWARIKQYAEIVIPIIRKNDPETMIIVGTPYWSNRPWRVVANPLTGANAHNTMYTFHYYAGTAQHNLNLDTVKTILDKIPVFATEAGLSEESGTGVVDVNAAQNFANVLGGNNPAGIKVSWCIWSFVDKNESSALLTPSSCTNGTWNSRSAAGNETYDILNTPAKDGSTCFPEPVIRVQPQSTVVKSGASTSMVVVASGEQLQYLWQKSADGIVWTDIVNSNNDSLTINVATISNEGYYRVEVSNFVGYVFSQKAFLNFYENGPYFGTALNIPGKIEAENYDIGGQNVSYYDSSPGNTGNAYRSDDVDIQSTTDSLGGYGTGYWVNGEWLEFSVNVLTSASYDFYFRVGSALAGTKFEIILDGNVLISQVNVPNLNSWSLLRTVAVKGINLTKGNKKLRVRALSDGFNLNYFEVIGPLFDCNLQLNGSATIDACGNCAGGNTGLLPKTDANKCYDVLTGITTVGVGAENVLLYPNPFEEHFFLRTSALVDIEIFDLYGKSVFCQAHVGSTVVAFPATLASGVYFVHYTSLEGKGVQKIEKR